MYSRKYVKYLAFIILSIFLISALFSLFGQDKEKKVEEKKPAGTNKTVIMAVSNYNPVAVTNPYFSISRLNLSRRYSPTGQGEFLDVVFDITNKLSSSVDLSAYVVAFQETNAVDHQLRRVIPYPRWRIHDPDGRLFLVHYITVTPKNIDVNSIWNEKDRDYIRFHNLIMRQRNAVSTMGPKPMVHPPFWKYLNYIAMNPAKGLKFKLYGEEGPVEAKQYQTNYVTQTFEEKRAKSYKNIYKHKYTLEHQRSKTIFRSHHYSKFRIDYKFFNKVAIIVFDSKKADKYEKAFKTIKDSMYIVQEERFKFEKEQKKIEYNLRIAIEESRFKEMEKLNNEKNAMRKKEVVILNKEAKIREDVAKLDDPLLIKKVYSIRIKRQ